MARKHLFKWRDLLRILLMVPSPWKCVKDEGLMLEASFFILAYKYYEYRGRCGSFFLPPDQQPREVFGMDTGRIISLLDQARENFLHLAQDVDVVDANRETMNTISNRLESMRKDLAVASTASSESLARFEQRVLEGLALRQRQTQEMLENVVDALNDRIDDMTSTIIKNL